MRISVTERQSYKRCRRRWDYSSYNRQSLSPVVNAPALDLGTLIHTTLADWTRDPNLDPVAHYTLVVQEYFQKLITLYTERVGCAPSQAELQPHLEAIALGQDMITNYQTKWHTPIPPGFTLIENELALVQPVPGTEHCKCKADNTCTCWEPVFPEASYIIPCWAPEHGVAECLCIAGRDMECCAACHELECTFDGLMHDESGNYYIIERKTFSRTPNLDELNNNDQFLAYMWAANQVWPGKVVGVAYDGLLKKSKPSGVHKTLDDLFLRRILLRNEHELAEFGEQLAWELNEMAANPPIYKTVPFMGCQRWECSFIDLCHATSRGETSNYNNLLKMFVRSERKAHLDVEVT